MPIKIIEPNLDMMVARKKKGLTQAQLAEKVEKSTVWISRLENGYERPSEDLRMKISEVLGVDSVDIFGGK